MIQNETMIDYGFKLQKH